MTGTLVIDQEGRRISAPTTFSYADLDAGLAVRLREQAATIRSRVRSQTDALIEIGRELIEIKKSLEHGTFAAWAEFEVGIKPRLAQIYMQVAEWAPSNTKLISHLQPTSVMKLSARATSPELVKEVEHRIDAGERVSTATVDSLIAAARREKAEQDRLAKEAAVPKRTKEARKARKEREEREAEERRRKREAEELQTRSEIEELASILVANLDTTSLARVKDILQNRDVTGRAFHCGVIYIPLIKVIEELEQASPESPVDMAVQDAIVNEGGIMDLWVREAHMFKAGETAAPPPASRDGVSRSDIQKQLDDARNELAVAHRDLDYQTSGMLAYGTIPALEKRLAQITEEQIVDVEAFTPEPFLNKGVIAAGAT